MVHVVKQWVARALSLCVVGPAAMWLSHRVLAPNGTRQTTMLTGDSFATGLMVLLGVSGLTLFTGVAVGRAVDRREGLVNMGFVLLWVAWTSGRIGEVLRVRGDAGTLVLLALEGLILAGVVLLGAMVLTEPRSSGRDSEPDDISRFDFGFLRATVLRKTGLAAMSASVLTGMVIAVLFGQTDLPGQSVGVGFGAGVLAGVAGTLAMGSIRSEDEPTLAAPWAPIVLGVMLCAVLGPLAGLIRPGAGGLESLVFRADLPGYLVITPAAWVMGALLGVPMGHSWVEHTHTQSERSAAKA